MTVEEADALVLSAATKLGEHFSSVQILASWNEECITNMTSMGCGDWYARIGMAHEFINESQAQNVGKEIHDAMHTLDEGDDECQNPSQ